MNNGKIGFWAYPNKKCLYNSVYNSAYIKYMHPQTRAVAQKARWMLLSPVLKERNSERRIIACGERT